MAVNIFINAISCITPTLKDYRTNNYNMKARRYKNSKNTKFVRIDNSTWIEADVWIPDEVARMQFIQKIQLTNPGQYVDQIKNNNLVVRS